MIIFFYGEDSFRIKQKLKQTRHRFTETVDRGAFSLTEIDGEKVSSTELSEKISTGSLFAQKRMIIINNIFNNKQTDIFKQLLILSKRQIADQQNALVFIDKTINHNRLKDEAKKLFSLLKSQPYAQEFKPLNHNQTLNFAKELFQAKQQPISTAALSLLVAKVGNDLWRLNNEVNKLKALGLNKKIERKDVEQVISGEFEEEIFNLIDAFFVKRKSLAYKILHEQLAAGLSPEYILNMLIRQIKILLEIKSAQKSISSEKLAAALNLHPFVVKKSLAQANNFSLIDLKSAFNHLVNLEYKSKSGQANLKNELFILAAEGLLF